MQINDMDVVGTMQNKVVEIVAGKNAPQLPEDKWFDL